MTDNPSILVEREWWKRITGGDKELYVEVMADFETFQLGDDKPAEAPVRLEFHGGSPDGEPGLIQHYSSLAKARAILTGRGWKRVDRL